MGLDAGACLLGDESCGKDRTLSMAAVVFVFVVRQHAESRREPEQFIVRKAKFPSAWMAMAYVVVDGEGFVDQDPVWFQRFDERGKYRAMEIEKHDDHVIFLLREFRPFIRCPFKVYCPDMEIGKVSLFRRGSELCHGLFIPVHRIDLIAVRGEIERVASGTGRDIESLAFR